MTLRGVPVALLPLLVACGLKPDTSLPSTLSHRGPTDVLACSNVTGTYGVQRHAIFDFVLRPRLSETLAAEPFDSVRVEGEAQDSLSFALMHGIATDTVWLRAGQDYQCARGWITLLRELRNDQLPSELIDPVRDDDRADRFEFAMTGVQGGRLVGRVVHESYHTISVWAASRGSRVPGTSRWRISWYEWGAPGVWSPEALEDSARSQRLLNEEYRLEHGTDPPR